MDQRIFTFFRGRDSFMTDKINILDPRDVMGQILCVRQMLRQLLPGIGAIALSTNLAVAQALPEATQSTGVPLSPYTQRGINYSSISLSDLPPELRGEGKWDAFKKLWQALDAIVPGSSGVEPFDGKTLVLFDEVRGQRPMDTNFLLPDYKHRLYYQALDEQGRQDFRNELHEIFGNDIEQLSPESKLLYRLTWLRIQELSLSERLTPDYTIDGFSSMTRMGPTYHTSQVSPTHYLVSAVDRIQVRANVLLELRAGGAIHDEVYALTLSALLADAKLVLYLDALTGHPQYGVENNIDAPLFRARDMAPIDLEPVDFTKPDSTKSLDTAADLLNIQTWQDAANSAYNRWENDNQYHQIGVAQEIKSLIQDLSVLRENLDRLNPLLTELEH